MKLLKQFLVRLSGNFFETLTPKLIPYRAKQKPPPLKLVSQPASGGVSRSHLPTNGQSWPYECPGFSSSKREDWLLGQQNSEQGFWVEELEADTTLTSEYVMLRRFLDLVDLERERKAVRYLLHTQLEDGGWPIFSGGPADISASVKAYFALKLVDVTR